MDPFQEELATYDWRYYDAHPSPRHVIDAQNGPQYYFYYTPYVAMRQGEYFRDGAAPQYGSTMIQLYPTKLLGMQQLGASQASNPTAAPTAGAYTGIASGCGPNGIPLSSGAY